MMTRAFAFLSALVFLWFFQVLQCTNVNDANDMLGTASEADDNETCGNLTIDSPWEHQKAILPCHYSTHTHPRMQPRKKRSNIETEDFQLLAIFNIKYDLDFMEAGERCSTKLHHEWLADPETGPVNLTEFSYNRIWYKRLCNFFSYLECIPSAELRAKSLEAYNKIKHQKRPGEESEGDEEESSDNSHPHVNHTEHKHMAAKPHQHPHPSYMPDENDAYDDHTTESPADGNNASDRALKILTLLDYMDSNKSTEGLVRLKIGGRGPGKGRHKSGPGGARVNIDDVLKAEARTCFEVKDYDLDGFCACSTFDKDYPTRPRVDYGMDFVEDQLRKGWCVAAPGNLCGRVYFKRNMWPGQNFEISDHIGCPKRYKDVEYECIQWQRTENKYLDENLKKLPNTYTSTCEIKQEEEDKKELEMMKRAEESDASKFRSSRLLIYFISTIHFLHSLFCVCRF